MPEILIVAEEQNFTSQFTGSTCTLRIYASVQAYSIEGEQITGAQTGGQTWYKEYDCTITSGIIETPEISLPSTTDAYPPNLTYTAVFYDESGARMNTKLSNFFLDPDLLIAYEDSVIQSTVQVTAAGTALAQGNYTYRGTYNSKKYWTLEGQASSTSNYAVRWTGSQWDITSSVGAVYYYSTEDVEFPWDVVTWVAGTGIAPLPAVTQYPVIISTTWNAVFLSNNTPCLACPPDIDLLYLWITNFINGRTIPFASFTVAGKTYLSKDPDVSNVPRAVGTNEFVWEGLNRIRSLDEWNGDLDAAITEIGSDDVTLLISEADMFTADTPLKTSGALTVGKAYQIVEYPGEVTYIENVDGGMGYTNGETGIPCTGGSGTGLTVDCTGVENGGQGIVAGIAINSGGADYQVGDVVELVPDIRNTVVVSAAGTGALNGIYTLRGTSGGKSYYNLTGQGNSTTLYAVVWNGSAWLITNNTGQTAYSSTNAVLFPWEVTTWTAGVGSLPVPTVAQAEMVVVAGAGTGAVDGFYTYRGTSNSKPYYNLFGQADSTANSAIVWNGAEWRITSAAGAVRYDSASNVAQPWLATWAVDTGAAPVPTVSQATACKLLINTVEGDVFTNVGCSWYGYPTDFANQAGTVFVATGTTPTTWTNGTTLRQCTTVPDNIHIQFWNGGSLRAENDGGIYISSMLDPGQVQVFTSDGSGKIFVKPNGVQEYNLAWWAGLGSGSDDTHEFLQAKESLQIGLVGGVLNIPAGDWYTTEIKWTSFTTVKGVGAALDGIFGTNIYAADLTAEYQGVFSAMQLWQGIVFKDFFLSQDTSLTCAAFRFVAVRSTCQNMTWDGIRIESVAAAGAVNSTIFKGETSFEEFVNINFYNCSWTCWDETNSIFWESTNSVSLWVNAQFRNRLDSNGVYFKYGGYHTFLQCEWRGVADYTNTLSLDRTITGACDTTALDVNLILTTDETVGNYLTREDLGRQIEIPGVTFDGNDDTYITSIGPSPWEFTVAEAPDQTVNNQNLSLYEVSDMPIANACIVADTHIQINVIGSSDEGYNYYFIDGAQDYMNTFNLYGSLIQSKMLFTAGGSSFHSYGNTYYSGALNATNGAPAVYQHGDTIQTYIIPRYQDRYPFPNIKALLTGEVWHLCPNELYTLVDDSTKQGDDQTLLYAITNHPAKFVQHAVFGGPAYTDPWVQILTTDFSGGNDQRLLRLGQAWKTSDVARYYYDFYRDSTTGYLAVEGNQGGSFVGLDVNGLIIADNSILSKGDVGGMGYTTGAGGTVTQLTSKATDVTLNKTSGQITMNNANLNAGAIVSFKVVNSSVRNNDTVMVNHISGGTLGAYNVWAYSPAALNCFFINVQNVTAGNLAEEIVLQFNLFRGVTS